MRATFSNIRAEYPKLVEAHKAINFAHEFVEGPRHDQFKRAVAQYNEMARRAALAFHEDTKAYNNLHTVLSVFANPVIRPNASIPLCVSPTVYEELVADPTPEEARRDALHDEYCRANGIEIQPAIDRLQRCIEYVGRIPDSFQYVMWVRNKRMQFSTSEYLDEEAFDEWLWHNSPANIDTNPNRYH